MKISVVIPCYNAESTIFKCLESVLVQSFKPIEIILIDDGSKDLTENVINDFIKISHIPVIFYKQENSGPSVARNKGVSMASGDWIAFLDSDDYWDQNRLSRQVEYLKGIDSNDVVLLGSGNIGELEFKMIDFKRLLKRNYFQTSAVLIMRKISLEFPFNVRQKYSEDYLCWLEICWKYKAVIVSPRSVFPIAKEIAYGGSGLSSRLVEMEKWELRNYLALYKEGKINKFTLFKVSTYSILKFFRRNVIKLINEK